MGDCYQGVVQTYLQLAFPLSERTKLQPRLSGCCNISQALPPSLIALQETLQIPGTRPLAAV